VLVLPFTPAKGAVIGLVAAVIASLVDLAVNFGEAGRRLAGDAPTFWVARHMQGPLGAFALTRGRVRAGRIGICLDGRRRFCRALESACTVQQSRRTGDPVAEVYGARPRRRGE
jgi:hypothetical protein